MKDEEIADYDRGFRIIITVRAAFATISSCEEGEIALESLPAFDTISSPKSDMPANEPFISKETVEHTSNCEFLLKIYNFPSIWKSLSPQRDALHCLRTNHIRSRLAFMRTSRKTYFRLRTNL